MLYYSFFFGGREGGEKNTLRIFNMGGNVEKRGEDVFLHNTFIRKKKRKKGHRSFHSDHGGKVKLLHSFSGGGGESDHAESGGK